MHNGMMQHLKEFHKKFKVGKENQGDKLVVTLSGSKEDVAMLDKKPDAFQVLTSDCCCCGEDKEGGCC
jgi:hypothetical protein